MAVVEQRTENPHPERRKTNRGYCVVSIGGGTGLSTLLKGLKKYVSLPGVRPHAHPIRELCAVVTVTDDGGSSGRLRKEFNMLAPGDIRNCIVALSEDEAMLSKLFQHRFKKGSGLVGHSFGNLFLTALTSITEDFGEAIRLSSEILRTRGRIFPVTTSHVELEALMQDGSQVRGETKITASKGRIEELFLIPKSAKPLPETLDAIARADLITIGPGSLFTSLVPNLLVPGVAQAIMRSKAIKVYVCNLMTQANESIGRSIADHIKALNEHAKAQLFDYALINNKLVSSKLKAKYAQETSAPIVNDLERVVKMGIRPVLGNYLEEGKVARHATDKVAHDLMALIAKLRAIPHP